MDVKRAHDDDGDDDWMVMMMACRAMRVSALI